MERNLLPFDPLEPGFSTKSSIKFFDEVVDSFVKVVVGGGYGYGRSFQLKVSFGSKLVFDGMKNANLGQVPLWP